MCQKIKQNLNHYFFMRNYFFFTLQGNLDDSANKIVDKLILDYIDDNLFETNESFKFCITIETI